MILELLTLAGPRPVGNDQFQCVGVWLRLRLGVASALFRPAAWQGLLGPSSFCLYEFSFPALEIGVGV